MGGTARRGWADFFAGRRTALFEAARAYLAGEAGDSLPPLGALPSWERRRLARIACAAAPSPRVMAVLGELAGPRATARLRDVVARERARLQCTPEGCGALLIAAAAALWRAAAWEACAPALAERLRLSPRGAERVAAVEALAAISTREAQAALEAALDDDDPFVRHAAARALLQGLGLVVDARACEVLQQRARLGLAAAV